MTMSTGRGVHLLWRFHNGDGPCCPSGSPALPCPLGQEGGGPRYRDAPLSPAHSTHHLQGKHDKWLLSCFSLPILHMVTIAIPLLQSSLFSFYFQIHFFSSLYLSSFYISITSLQPVTLYQLSISLCSFCYCSTSSLLSHYPFRTNI